MHSLGKRVRSWLLCCVAGSSRARRGPRLTPRARGDEPSKQQVGETAKHLFARENLVAWCIVPFDSKNRTPEVRAAMLARLGFKRFAYDWRAEHIPSFDAEMDAASSRKGIALDAFWSRAPAS